MKLTSIGMIASGLMLVATTAAAAPLTSSPRKPIHYREGSPDLRIDVTLPAATDEIDG